MSQENEPAAKRDLNKLEAKIDSVEERLTVKIDANAAKIDANRQTIEKVVRQVVENGARLDQMVTREEFNKRMDELVAGQDRMISIFTQLNQEPVATNARLDRVETDVEKNKRDIKEIKAKLAMP